MQYFPLRNDRFEHQFGVRALRAGESIMERTEKYEDQIALKRKLLDEDQANYFQALPGSQSAQREAAALVISSTDYLSHETNALTGESIEQIDALPLLAVGRHVQEDLAILSGDAATGHPLIAGVVCFPSGWTIRDKIGKSILQIHQPVPEFASVMGGSTNRLLGQLKPGRPVWRMNWGVRPSSALDQSPKHAERQREASQSLTAENAGLRCYFRTERQTLSRLPETDSILFTIHTHQCPLAELAGWQKANLLGVIESCPAETLRYKGIAPIRELLQKYLRGQQESS